LLGLVAIFTSRGIAACLAVIPPVVVLRYVCCTDSPSDRRESVSYSTSIA